MCWTGKDDKVMIANTDIPVFKIAKIRPSDDKVYSYFQGWCFEYIPNVIYETDAIHFEIRPKFLPFDKVEYCVNKAMHSYSVNNIRLSTDTGSSSLRIATHKTTPLSPEVIARSPLYDAVDVAVMLCVIPKGTRYAINGAGEIVSDIIEVSKIIKRPFTFNKDKSLSKRSVEKVNKILNNWEKGKL